MSGGENRGGDEQHLLELVHRRLESLGSTLDELEQARVLHPSRTRANRGGVTRSGAWAGRTQPAR